MFTILLFGKAWEINERLKGEDDSAGSVVFLAFLALIFVWPVLPARLLYHAGMSQKVALLVTVIPGAIFALLSIGLYLAVGLVVALIAVIGATCYMTWTSGSED